MTKSLRNLHPTIARQVELMASAYPDTVAAEIVGGRAWTYSELYRRAQAIAQRLGDVPAGPHGRMVAILLPNGIDMVLAYIACQLLGVAAVPVNTRLAPREIRFILDDSAAGILLSGGDQLERAIRASEGSAIQLMSCDEIEDDAFQGAAHDLPGSKGSDIAVVFYTSGTTGFPKGAAITNDCWAQRLVWWGWEFDIRAEDVMLVPGPIFHMGFSSMSLAALLIGAKLRIVPRFDVPVAAHELNDECTWALLIPTMTTMLLERWRETGRRPMESARVLLSSGAALSKFTIEDMLDAFPNAKIWEAYGWTEGGWVTKEAKVRGSIVPHCVGWPAFGSHVVILDDDRNLCARGVAGEVAARSPVPFDHYLNRAEATEKSWHGEYQLTGDIGTFMEDGRLLILDRRNDMIVTGGENVYSSEVERVLGEHPGILEYVVVGRPDPRWGQAVVGVVVPRPGVVLDAAQVREFCRLHLAGYKCPKHVEIVDALPRNSMGKVEKFKVRESIARTAAPQTQEAA